MTAPPVVAPPFETVGRPETRVAGVLLAAGTSSRFGDANKLLAEFNGDPLARHAARTLAAAGLDPLVAIVGHEADRVRAVFDGLGFTVVENPDYADGQATSVQAAVETLSAEVDAAVFALGDMPTVSPETVALLVAAHRAGHGSALAAAHEGVRGNPVLFAASQFPTLAGVSGDVGGRELLRASEDSALVETGDPGVRRDVDTRDDLAAVRDDR
jgi:molybdenum cofactor cytidylyltransferase